MFNVCRCEFYQPNLPNHTILFIHNNNQGIHTSSAKGTMKRNCHQDWLMGKCGRAQDAAGIFPRGKSTTIIVITQC